MRTSDTDTPKLFWWLWPLALLAGMLLGGVSLSYAPDGRINLPLVWLLWAALPFVGTLAATLLLLRPASRPWISRFSGASAWWQPTAEQRWWLLSRLHWLWAVFACGILLIFLLLLVFSDLAFGWSSTLLSNSQVLLPVFQSISLPWQAFWPQAVPDLVLLEQTHFARIEPTPGGFAAASRWWSFLLASLLVYNLLPRLLLAGYCHWRWSRMESGTLQIDALSAQQPVLPALNNNHLQLGQINDWQQASCIHWQLTNHQTKSSLQLGVGDWQEEQQHWQQWLTQPPRQLIWQVSGSRTPVAELADYLTEARSRGIQQALQLVPVAATTERHQASWKAFARAQQLIWLEPNT